MNSSYESYQKARDASWKCLIEHGISNIPVSITALLRAEGIPYGCYSDNAEQLRKNGLSHLMQNDGFTIRDSAGRISVYFNEHMPPQRCRFTLAHELGHIRLGHLGVAMEGELLYTVLNREPDSSDDRWEREANIFASRLLAPACILREIGIHDPEEIAQLCGISLTAARFRAERMEKLYRRERRFDAERGRSCFYRSPLEQTVFEQFGDFIQKHKSKQ